MSPKSVNPISTLLLGLSMSVSLSLLTLPASAATVIEEIIVSAQRSEENLQDVPIAVTALTGEMLEDKGIISPSDLQMAAPNVSFTATNFGGASFSIRGIGRLVIGTTGESGVSTHLDEIPVATNLNAIEFFDVARVEVLRGPQGTLFGRNATGGSINVVTRMPDYDSINGFLDVEGGDFSNARVKGAINFPLGDSAGLRLAGFRLKRDGYIENTAYGLVDEDGDRLSGIDDDIDGRDISAVRATFSWDLTENSHFWVQHNYFTEDDDRARLTNQVCKRTVVPALGCEPDEFGFDSPHPGSTTAGIFFGLNGQDPSCAGLPGCPGSLPLGEEGIPVAGGGGGFQQDYPQPAGNGLRAVHTDFEPVFEYKESLTTLGYEYVFGNFTVGFLGAYQETEYISQIDYNLNVGPTLYPSPDSLELDGRWPTSMPAPGGAGSTVEGNLCNYNAGTAGIFGGGFDGGFRACVNSDDGRRSFSMDQVDNDSEYWTTELRIASSLDGAFNFQAGISAYSGEQFGDYYVAANGLDSVGLVGVPNLGFPPLYPTTFNVPGNPNNPTLQEGWAVFTEFYFELTDRLKLTTGLRYNKDNKEPNSANAFYSAQDQSSILYDLFFPGVRSQVIAGGVAAQVAAMGLDPAATDPLTVGTIAAITAGVTAAITALTPAQVFAAAAPGLPLPVDSDFAANLAMLPGGQIPTATVLERRWSRISSFLNPLLGLAPVDENLLLFHGVTQAEIDAAAVSPAYSAERIAISNTVGLVSGFNEVRVLSNSPTKDTWTAVTGRIGLDYQLNDEILLYGFFSRGYKPGGFNPPIAIEFQSSSSFIFDEEEVDSIEVGFKSTLADGQIILNGTAFVYDYTGLQVTRIRNNSSLNENIDAAIMGIEVEWVWQPEVAPNLSLDGSLSWLDTDIDNVSSVDVTNKAGGEPDDWVNLKNIDPGALTGTNYIARLSQLTPDLVLSALALGPSGAPGALDVRNGQAAASSTYPGTPVAGTPAGIPAYFSRNWLNGNGVETSDGIPVSLSGNSLPNAPDFTFRLGAQYTWPIQGLAGSLTLRWDFYWQDDSYAREFNTRGDKIDSWDQHNMSLIYESTDKHWQARGFVRNIQDEDNVTGHYLTSDTSGFFRNYFLTEPRIYGLSVRYAFGEGG